MSNYKTMPIGPNSKAFGHDLRYVRESQVDHINTFIVRHFPHPLKLSPVGKQFILSKTKQHPQPYQYTNR